MRRSQLLLGGGPGALVDLIDHAVIVGGLDSWGYAAEGEGYLSEPRLQQKAHRLLTKAGLWDGRPMVRLRMPPTCDDDQSTDRVGIPVGKFPGWFLCQNTACRSLVHWKGLNKRGRHVCKENEKKDWPVVPIRFVTACTHGHIQDVDWPWFVHTGRAQEGFSPEPGSYGQYCVRGPGSKKPDDPLGPDWTAPFYLATVGTSGDLADLVIGCRACGARRGMQDLAVPGGLGLCHGRRPWLGWRSSERDCKETARLLTRTQSNAYFPQTISVLSIPDPSDRLRKAVEEVWSILQVATAENLAAFRAVPQVAKALEGFSDDEVMREVIRRQRKLPITVPKTRETEWLALISARYEEEGDHPKPGERWFARRLRATDLPDFIERIVLVRHLTEVRAQVGFTRVEGNTGDAEGEFSLDVRTAPLGLDTDWIPAVEIHGEGIFLAFDLDKIHDWEGREAVEEREEHFRAAMARYNEGRKVPALFTGARLLMLHSLAHLLIRAISLECGYPATSIRERIYCSADEDVERAGILLYTGSPGSEGTLGGLVEVGRDIVQHLRRAVEMGVLCSNDPVCAQHNPASRQEGREREGAACHGCLLIGEPSCERQNSDLDRQLVVPTVETSEAAFLRDWVATWT